MPASVGWAISAPRKPRAISPMRTAPICSRKKIDALASAMGMLASATT